MAEQVQGLRDMVPKALEGWKEKEDKRVEELGNEVRSLRLLLQNRVGGGGGGGAQTPVGSGQGQAFGYRGALGGEQERTSSPGVGGAVGGAGAGGRVEVGARGRVETGDEGAVAPAPAPGITVPKREGSASRGFGSGRAAIPAWQMAAKSKNAEGGGGSDAGA